MIKIFPIHLVRISGGHAEKMHDFFFEDLSSSIKELMLKKVELNEFKLRICDNLFALISQIDYLEDKRKLLNFKRDFYNDRAKQKKKLWRINHLLQEDLSYDISRYYELQAKLTEIRSNARQIYQYKLQQELKLIRNLSSEETFLKGLVMSSPVLFQQTQNFIKDSENRRLDNIKLSKALLKYLARYIYKTSPFSTLTSVGLAKSAPIDTIFEFIEPVSNNGIVQYSKIRINVLLFGLICKHILFEYEEFYHQYKIKLNPSFTQKEKIYEFILPEGTGEKFQTINRNEVIDKIIDIKTQQLHTTFDSLVDDLFRIMDEERTEIAKFVKNLITSGLLQFDIGISGGDPDWDVQLISYLKLFESDETPNITRLVRVLQDLHNDSKSLEVVNSIHRYNILIKSHQSLKNVFYDIYKSNAKDDITYEGFIFPLKPNKIFFEDAYNKVKIKIQEKLILEKIDELNTLLISLDGIKKSKSRKEILCEFFKKYYKTREKVDFTSFYKKYQSLTKADKMTESLVSETDKLRPSLRKSIMDRFHHSNANQIDLELDDFKYLESIRKPSDVHMQSMAAFIQPYIENGELYLVLGGTFTGYGKLLSRFLYLFNNEVTTDLNNWNKSLMQEGVLSIENCDSSLSNANIHPNLLDYELASPNSSNGYSKDRQINLSDIDVGYDEQKDEVYLEHRKLKKEIIPYDLGIQGLAGRSNLFQFVDHFSSIRPLHVQNLIRQINDIVIGKKKNENNPKVIRFPRIVYNKTIIIQRQYWFVPVMFLHPHNSETDEDYYIRINEWRYKQKIPSKTFVRINKENVKLDISKKKMKNNDYKPQYIDFDSAVFTLIFKEIVEKAPESIMITEMLPKQEELTKINFLPYVHEYVIQWAK